MDKNSLQGAKFPLRTTWVVKPLSLRVHSELIEMQTAKLCIYLMLNIVVVVLFFSKLSWSKTCKQKQKIPPPWLRPRYSLPDSFQVASNRLACVKDSTAEPFFEFLFRSRGHWLPFGFKYCCLLLRFLLLYRWSSAVDLILDNTVLCEAREFEIRCLFKTTKESKGLNAIASRGQFLAESHKSSVHYRYLHTWRLYITVMVIKDMTESLLYIVSPREKSGFARSPWL